MKADNQLPATVHAPEKPKLNAGYTTLATIDKAAQSGLKQLPFDNVVIPAINNAAAAINAISPNVTYEQAKQNIAKNRAALSNALAEQHPYLNRGAELTGSVAGSLPLLLMATPAGAALSGAAKARGIGKIGQAVAQHGGTFGAFEGLNALTHPSGASDYLDPNFYLNAAKKTGEGLLTGGIAGPIGEGVSAVTKAALPNWLGHYMGNLLGGATMGTGFAAGTNLLEGRPVTEGMAESAGLMGALGLIGGGKYYPRLPEIKPPVPVVDPIQEFRNDINNQRPPMISRHAETQKLLGPAPEIPPPVNNRPPMISLQGPQPNRNQISLQGPRPNTNQLPPGNVPELLSGETYKRPPMISLQGPQQKALPEPNAYTKMMIDLTPKIQAEVSKTYAEGYQPSPQQFERFVRDVAKVNGYDYDAVKSSAGVEIEPQKQFKVEGTKNGNWATVANKAAPKSSNGGALTPEPLTPSADTKVLPTKETTLQSKVVNKKGELQPVYHGSMSEFTKFKHGDIGFHFGNKTQAKSKVGNSSKAKIYEVYLDIKNPVIINKDLGSWDADYKLPEELLEVGAITKEQYNNFRSKSYSGSGYNSKASIEMRKILEQNGYDGIKYINWHEGGKADSPAWIAFKDSQITRSAPQPSIITDPARVHEVKNSISEGELILKSGKINGRKMSADELGMVRRSVDSSKAKIGENASDKSLPEQKPTLINKLDQMEADVKASIKKKSARLNSNPADIWADYVKYGSIKIAKGAVKFADWSAEMIKDFGNVIKPHLKKLWTDAQKHHADNYGVNPPIANTQPKQPKQPKTKSPSVSTRFGKGDMVTPYDNTGKQIGKPGEVTDVIHDAETGGTFYKLKNQSKYLPEEWLKRHADVWEDMPIDTWKDKGMLRLNMETSGRNLIDMAGPKNGEILKENLIGNIHADEAKLNRWSNKIKNKIKLLKLSDKEAELVVKLGEGKISNVDVPIKSRDRVVKAVAELRRFYDESHPLINEVLTRNGYKPIGKIENYFPHGDGTDPVLKALGINLETVNLPTDINGITHLMRPGKSWSGHLLQRKTDMNTLNALEGLDRYIESVGNVIFQTDNIQRLRRFTEFLRSRKASPETKARIKEIKESSLSKELKDVAVSELLGEQRTHLSNTVANLTDFTDVLANKKSLGDRSLEHMVGRWAYSVSTFLVNRVAKNIIAINPSIWLTQFIPLTQLAATTSKKSFTQALNDTMRNKVNNDGFVDRSTFLTNRLSRKQLSESKLDKVGNFLSAPQTMIDLFSAEVVTRGRYLDALRKGMDPEKAMKYADESAAKMMADRSKGSLPVLFNSKNALTKMVTLFQLEVNNQIRWMLKDLPKEYMSGGKNVKNIARLTSALTQLVVYGWLYNQVKEKVAGNRSAFDPINIAFNLYEDVKAGEKASKTVFNATSDTARLLPFASGVLGGGRIPVSSATTPMLKLLPDTLKAMAGEGKWNAAGKDLFDVSAFVGMPFGGGQIKKTVEGFNAIKKGKVTDKNGKLLYRVDRNPANIFKGLLFGKSALPETQAYYKKKGY